jgi:hypothetical protein
MLGAVFHSLRHDHDVSQMAARLSEENGLPLTRLNKGDAPVGFENCHRNPRESRSRAHIENRNRFVSRREVSSEEQGLAVVPDHHLRSRLYRGQVHSLVPTDKQFVVCVELADLRLTQL